MKYLIVFITFLFLINGCKKEINYSKMSDHEIVLSFQPNDSSHPYYVNLINPDICFRCSPSYTILINKFSEYKFPKENIIYVFPTKRTVLHKKIKDDIFGKSQNSFKIIFNSDIYNAYYRFYHLDSLTPYLLIYNSSHRLVYTGKYNREISNDLIKKIFDVK